MTQSKITKIEFLNRDDFKKRQVRVTLSAGETYIIDPLWGGFIQRTTQENACRTVDLAMACSGYLNGDRPESISYNEIHHADLAFDNDCVHETFVEEDNDETYTQALHDFIDHIAHFEDWEARV